MRPARLLMPLVAAATVTAVAGAAALALPAAPASAAPGISGPDVSAWQHPGGRAIDWGKVAGSGRSFAFVKATEGAGYSNPWYAADQGGARAAGLAVGGYAFARPALPLSTAADQARRLVSVVGTDAVAGSLPPVLDLEVDGGLSAGQLVTWAQTFLEEVHRLSGRTPVLYTYPYFWSGSMASSRAFGRYPLWLASYGGTAPAPLPGWPAWTAWQYTSVATVPGIATSADDSRFAGTADQLAALADGRVATPWPVVAPSAPVRLAAAPGVRSATVSWVPGDDGGSVASSYVVTTLPSGPTVTVAGTRTSVTLTGLQPGKAYRFAVTAVGAAGRSAPSAPSGTVVPGQLPTTPTGLLAVAGTSGAAHVDLGWSAAAGLPTNYRVYRCSPAPCVPGGTPVAYPAGTSWTDTGVTGGTRYSYRVSARNDWGASGLSAAVTARPVTVPGVPRHLSATAAPTGLTATWDVPFTDGGTRITGWSLAVDGRPAVLLPAAARSRVLPGYGDTAAHTVVLQALNTAGLGRSVSASTPVATPAVAVHVPAALTLTGPAAAPMAGTPFPVTVHASAAGGTAQAGVPVTVTIVPAAGAAPAPRTVVTDATGNAVTWVTAPTSVLVRASSAAGSVARRVGQRVGLTGVLSAATVVHGHTVVMTGRTSPLLAGERAVRQGFYDGAWHAWASTLVGRDGTFRFGITPTVPATNLYRVFLTGTPLHVAEVTRAVRLQVR